MAPLKSLLFSLFAVTTAIGLVYFSVLTTPSVRERSTLNPSHTISDTSRWTTRAASSLFQQASREVHHLHAAHGSFHRREVTWERAIERGSRMNCYFSMTVDEMDQAQEWSPNPTFGYPRSSQSEYTNAGDLKKYGWGSEEIPADFAESYLPPYYSIFKDLSIPADLKAWVGVYSEHEKEVTVTIDGATETFPATKADDFMFMTCQESHHSIFTISFGSPRSKGVTPITPLSAMSDVIYLKYQSTCLATGKKGSLSTWFQYGITNVDTNKLIRRTLEDFGHKDYVVPWPGLELRRGDPHFLALLGSPNGMSVAWLIAQHKRQLGIRKVSSITIFQRPGVTNNHDLLFRFDNVGRMPLCPGGVDLEVDDQSWLEFGGI